MKHDAWRAIITTFATLALTSSRLGVNGDELTQNAHIEHHSLGHTEAAEGSSRDKGWISLKDLCGTDLAIPKVTAPAMNLQQSTRR